MSIPLSPANPLDLLDLRTSQPSPGTSRVAATGEVDLFTAAALLQRLLQVLGEQTPAVLEVDLAGVTFLDCHGVHALVVARDTAAEAGIPMRVVHPQSIVRRVLDLFGPLGVVGAESDTDLAHTY